MKIRWDFSLTSWILALNNSLKFPIDLALDFIHKSFILSMVRRIRVTVFERPIFYLENENPALYVTMKNYWSTGLSVSIVNAQECLSSTCNISALRRRASWWQIHVVWPTYFLSIVPWPRVGFTNGTNSKINVRSEKPNSKIKNAHSAKFCFSLLAIDICGCTFISVDHR